MTDDDDAKPQKADEEGDDRGNVFSNGQRLQMFITFQMLNGTLNHCFNLVLLKLNKTQYVLQTVMYKNESYVPKMTIISQRTTYLGDSSNKQHLLLLNQRLVAVAAGVSSGRGGYEKVT